jgi:hypothetical protein
MPTRPYVSNSTVVEFETRHFPLVLLDLGGSDRKPDELRAVFGRFREVNERARAEGKRWVLIAATDSVPNAIERKVIAEETNKVSKEDHALTLVAVLVVPNAIIRSALTAIGWMTRTTAPMTAAPSPSAAVDVAVERLRAIGIECSQQRAERAKAWFLRKAPAPTESRVAGDGSTR